MPRKIRNNLEFVQWSKADRLFVGYCPDFFIGGVCHGADEQKVYRDLSRLVAEESPSAPAAAARYRRSPRR
jgi:hypothetical protein